METFSFKKDLQKGDFGPDVFKLQRFLEALGLGDFVPTGYFGEKTFTAVKAFQKYHDIVPISGFFGPKTRTVANGKIVTMNREKIWKTALFCLGTDASPHDIAPDEYGCAETVTTILQKADVEIPIFVSTYQLYQYLQTSRDFIRVDHPLPGDIIISPTGYGNGALPNGHTGIVDENGKIMSNSSADGIFTKNYSLEGWNDRYAVRGGYPVVFFRKI